MSKPIQPTEQQLREVRANAPWPEEKIATLLASKDRWQARAIEAERVAHGWWPIEDHPGTPEPVDLWRDGERLTDFCFVNGRWQKVHGYPAVTTVLVPQPTHFMTRPADPS